MTDPCPGCRSCEAMDRLFAVAKIYEETYGDPVGADGLNTLAALIGRKDPAGLRMAAALLGEPQ